MRSGSISAAIAAALLACAGAVTIGRVQAQEKPAVSDEVFKNVQVLKGIPVDQFMATMGFFSASLGMSCEDCHMADDRNWDGFAADNNRKRVARRMIAMAQKINADNFGGRQLVTCYSCHRGADAPRTVADFAIQYGPPQPPDPNAIIAQARLAPMPAAVFTKYLDAVGGPARAAALTSIAATGTNVGYGPESADKRPTEIYATSMPSRRTVVVHTSNGIATSTCDGTNAWQALPLRPVDVLALAGQELAGAKIDAMLQFPAQVQTIATRWRVGVPATIDDREVQVVQGTATAGIVVTLYFDEQTGLMTRAVRLTDSPVGKIPVQVDYADYRDVNGVKLPFKFTQTWLNGRDTFELTEVRPNANIDGSRFARPARSVAPAPRQTP